MMVNHFDLAKKLKLLLIESSPMIEEYTADVCPSCTMFAAGKSMVSIVRETSGI